MPCLDDCLVVGHLDQQAHHGGPQVPLPLHHRVDGAADHHGLLPGGHARGRAPRPAAGHLAPPLPHTRAAHRLLHGAHIPDGQHGVPIPHSGLRADAQGLLPRGHHAAAVRRPAGGGHHAAGGSGDAHRRGRGAGQLRGAQHEHGRPCRHAGQRGGRVHPAGADAVPDGGRRQQPAPRGGAAVHQQRVHRGAGGAGQLPGVAAAAVPRPRAHRRGAPLRLRGGRLLRLPGQYAGHSGHQAGVLADAQGPRDRQRRVPGVHRHRAAARGGQRATAGGLQHQHGGLRVVQPHKGGRGRGTDPRVGSRRGGRPAAARGVAGCRTEQRRRGRRRDGPHGAAAADGGGGGQQQAGVRLTSSSSIRRRVWKGRKARPCGQLTAKRCAAVATSSKNALEEFMCRFSCVEIGCGCRCITPWVGVCAAASGVRTRGAGVQQQL